MNMIKSLPSNSEAVRSPRSKIVYMNELDALVQQDLLPDIFRSVDEEKPDIDTGMKYYKTCRIRCLSCGDVLERNNQMNEIKDISESFMWCRCRKVGLDPAAARYRILGFPENYEDLSEEWPEE